MIVAILRAVRNVVVTRQVVEAQTRQRSPLPPKHLLQPNIHHRCRGIIRIPQLAVDFHMSAQALAFESLQLHRRATFTQRVGEGGGLAGSEAALAAADRGVQVR